MTNYPTQEVLFNEGEGIDFADLNSAQRFIRGQLWDLSFASAIRSTETEDAANSSLAYCHPAGNAAPVQSATARTLTNTSGLLVKKTSSVYPLGSDAGVMVHYVAAGDMAVQLAVGDATNPRIDRVLYKLEYVDNDATDQESRIVRNTAGVISTNPNVVKRRKIKVTMQVVQGTPAGSPTAPSITSYTVQGYVLWAEVYVPATHNAAIDIDNIRDWRIPVGYDVHRVIGSDGGAVWFGSGWSKLTTGPGIQSTGAATAYIFTAARALHAARLLRFGMVGLFTGCTVELVRVVFDNTGSFGGETVLQDVSSTFTGGSNAYLETVSFTNPIWLNGYAAGIAAVTNPEAAPNDARMTMFAVKLSAPSSGKYLKFANFGVAAS